MFEAIGVLFTLLFGIFSIVSGIALLVINDSFGSDKATKWIGFFITAVGFLISAGVISVLEVSVR